MSRLFLALCLAAFTGCTTMGFDPRHDAEVALARAATPSIQVPAALRKQDPRASLTLMSDPRIEKGYMVLTIAVNDLPPELLREIDDPRQTYWKYAGDVVSKDGQLTIELRCKEGKPTCATLDDVITTKSTLHRRVWRAAAYGSDGQMKRQYDGVFRPSQKRFLVLVPLADWSAALGQEVAILGAYGSFVIARDGTTYPTDGQVATLPPAVPKLPVKFADLVRMTRDEPEGKYFLGVLAREFPLPAPFQLGAAHPDLYLGAVTLTPEETPADCWVGHGGGTLVLSPLPHVTVITAVTSFLLSVPKVASQDCGGK